MKFTIPIVEKVSSNKIYSGCHWGTRKKIADKYHEAIGELNLKSLTMKEINLEPKELIITFYFYNRPLDCSNCFYMAKMIEDGMVRSGWLKDDSPEYVKSITCISKVDKENPRIEIELK